jgi:mannose-6-phosphate isomerase-like protein (cupin superfamily)
MLGTIENPVTGECVRWLRSTPDVLWAEWRIAPGGHALDLHRHPRSEERIEVVAGVLGLELDGRVLTLHPGDTVTIPAGAAHRVWNDADRELLFHAELTEPGRMRNLVDTLFRLAREGRTDKNGLPDLLCLAAILRDHRDDVELAWPPAFISRPMFAALAQIHRVVPRAPAA